MSDFIPDDLKEIISSYHSNSLIEACIRVLSEQPNYHKVRVFLSKLYFESGYIDFAIRELDIVKQSGNYPLVDRILSELGVVGSKSLNSTVIAEVKI